LEHKDKAITGARVELLNIIRTQKPKSIQEPARLVKQDFKNVYSDIKFLHGYGLIELKEQGLCAARHIPRVKSN